ncbi:MAG TPA: hypothetical protein VKU85_16750, partial [bacterium]|nr:hypothetical protein [bacterium]
EAARQAAGGRKTPPAAADSGTTFDVSIPDRGELLVELEMESRRDARVPLRLSEGRWTVAQPLPEGTVRYRLVIDGTIRRIDPFSPRVVMIEHEPWSERALP